jgi:hypothetical protein
MAVKPVFAPQEIHALRLPEAMERLDALLRTREKLVQKVTKVQAAIAQIEALLQVAATVISSSLAPMLRELTVLQRDIHLLFRELLVRGRLKTGPRRQVKRLYELLQEQGFLEPLDEIDTAVKTDARDEEEERRAHEAWRAQLPDEHETGTVTAPAVQPLADALRAVFRRLARALHPDTVQDPAEQARRTEAMKEVTQAHQMADLARLLEIERRWCGTAAFIPATSADETEQRCLAVTATITALEAQVRSLESELRALRKSERVRAMKSVKRDERGRAQPLGDVVESATADLTAYRRIHDLVRRFRDGKATLDELLGGPDAL